MGTTIKRSVGVFSWIMACLFLQNCGPGFQSLPTNEFNLSSQTAGKTLYTQNCSGCHGALEVSVKQNRGFEEIKMALTTVPQMSHIRLTDQEIHQISLALQNSDCQPTNEVQTSPLQRIALSEFQNSVSDLFSLPANYIGNFQPDPLTNGFSRNAHVLSIGDVDVENFYSATSTIGADILRLRQSQIFTCSSGANCARQIFVNVGFTLFRKPLTANSDPVEQLIQRVYNPSVTRGENFQQAVILGLQAMMMSPEFLYHDYVPSRPNDDQQVVDLNEYELAERLASFLWNSVPDSQLMGLAGQGQLKSQLQVQVNRMLNDAKASAIVDEFFYEWLKLKHFEDSTPDTAVYPLFSSQTKSDMKTETQMFLDDLLQNDQTLYQLLKADYSFLNQNLANIYNVSGVTGNSFQKVRLPANQRFGVITQGSILTMNSKSDRSNVIARGFWTLENILCDEPPPPPQDFENNGAQPGAESSLRAMLEAHRNSSTSCYSCHSVMDPLGFSLENFDGMGAWRTSYNDGMAVDNLGTLPDGTDFSGPQGLIDVIESKQRFGYCSSIKMMTYALARAPSQDETCRAHKNGKLTVQARRPLSETIMNVINDPSFLQKRGGR